MFDLTINFKKLRDDLIPMYRELDILLKVFLSPIEILYKNFIKYRLSAHYDIVHNGQVIYLQKALNDRFDTDLILITDGDNLEDTYVYRKIELSPVILYRKSENENVTTIYRKIEYTSIIDFVVEIPLSLGLTPVELTELKAIVSKYKLPNKNFKIKLI